MSNNPLFSNNPVKPADADQAAIELIRAKVARAFGSEPDAGSELAGAETQRAPSKHQLFMRELSSSGKSIAEIQTAWHHYYVMLPDAEKRQVWEEFYVANRNTPYQKLFQKTTAAGTAQRNSPPPAASTIRTSPAGVTVASSPVPRSSSKKPSGWSGRLSGNSSAAIRQRVRQTVNANGKLQLKHHVQSLLFGLGMGGLVLVILLFSFFNEVVIAPFIQPSRNVSATPIIVGGQVGDTANPTIIIPKINLQVPIDYNVASSAEEDIQSGLNNGIVHYPDTALPGQNGNGAYFGHSSRNIFSAGKYKFAFAILHRITTGDIFSIVYNGKVYYYQVFAKEIVPPTQVSILHDSKGKQATAMLVTCDPPGLNINRLVVWGEQIMPAPSTNTTTNSADTTELPAQLTGNGPTLWSRMIRNLQFWRSD